MADTARARKLSERIQQVVAQMLDTRIKDPRLGFVTVTDVRVTGDLQHADVFYTVLQVTRDPDVRDGHEAQARVLDPGVEHLRDDLLDALAELAGAGCVRHRIAPSV